MDEESFKLLVEEVKNVSEKIVVTANDSLQNLSEQAIPADQSSQQQLFKTAISMPLLGELAYRLSQTSISLRESYSPNSMNTLSASTSTSTSTSPFLINDSNSFMDPLRNDQNSNNNLTFKSNLSFNNLNSIENEENWNSGSRGSNSRSKATGRRRGRKPIDKSTFVCHMCGTKDTPEWRKGPRGKNTLCNACGLKYAKEKKQRREDREKREKKKRRVVDSTSDDSTTSTSNSNLSNFNSPNLLINEGIPKENEEQNEVEMEMEENSNEEENKEEMIKTDPTGRRDLRFCEEKEIKLQRSETVGNINRSNLHFILNPHDGT